MKTQALFMFVAAAIIGEARAGWVTPSPPGRDWNSLCAPNAAPAVSHACFTSQFDVQGFDITSDFRGTLGPDLHSE